MICKNVSLFDILFCGLNLFCDHPIGICECSCKCEQYCQGNLNQVSEELSHDRKKEKS